MTSAENSEFGPAGRDSVERINRTLSEGVRKVYDELCENMIKGISQLVQAKLTSDAEQLELFEMAGSPPNKSVPLFVRPDMLEAPMEDDEPQQTLVVKLKRKAEADPEGSLPGDTLRVFLPVDIDYEYPAPLPDDSLPRNLFIEVSDSQNPTLHMRYIIQGREEEDAFSTMMQPGRYEVIEYTSAADEGGEEIIHDALSERVIHQAMVSRVPIHAVTAMSLITSITDYDIVADEISISEIEK